MFCRCRDLTSSVFFVSRFGKRTKALSHYDPGAAIHGRNLDRDGGVRHSSTGQNAEAPLAGRDDNARATAHRGG